MPEAGAIQILRCSNREKWSIEQPLRKGSPGRPSKILFGYHVPDLFLLPITLGNGDEQDERSDLKNGLIIEAQS